MYALLTEQFCSFRFDCINKGVKDIYCLGVEKGSFEYRQYYTRPWWDFGPYYSSISLDKDSGGYTRKEYIDDLKSFAPSFVYDESEVDRLIDIGFTLDEIEEYMYCGGEI